MPEKSPQRARPIAPRDKPPFLRNVAKTFEANLGQADTGINFISRGGGSTVYLRPTEVTLVVATPALSPTSPQAPQPQGKVSSSTVLSIRFLRARANAEPKPGSPLMTRVSDFSGTDPKLWRKDIPTYGRVHYQGVYSGVDVAYHGTSRELEYDFLVAPRTDPKIIRMAFAGAESLRLDDRGDLFLHVGGRELLQRKPAAYQELNGERKPVEVSYVLYGRTHVGLRVGPYDTSRPLVIDPVLSYSALLGDIFADVGNHVAVDLSGNAYVAGRTNSGISQDAVVAKYGASGGLLWSNRFHGNANGEGTDDASGIALDGSGNIYVVGTTTSYNFPVTPNAFSQNCGGLPGTCNQNISGVRQPDAFILKLDTAGNVVYSSFFGGPSAESANAISVDRLGMAYITGGGLPGSIPVKAGFPATPHGGGNCWRAAYVAKFDPAQSGANSLVYSSLLGGDGGDEGTAIAVVPVRKPRLGQGVYVAGMTGYTCTAGLNTKFPTTAGAFAADGGLLTTAFITFIDPTGTQIQYSSILYGTNDAFGVAADFSRKGYLTGSTSGGLPVTTNAFQATYKSGFSDAYVAKFDPALTGAASLAYATYLGGTSEDLGRDIAVDAAGRATVTGMTRAVDFPVTPNAIQSANKGGTCGTQNWPCPDVFITRLNSLGTALDFSTYLGGTSYDEGRGVALNTGNVFITGTTLSADFPVTTGVYRGNYDVFVARVTLGSDLAVAKTATPDPVAAGQNVTYTIRVRNNGPDDSPGVRVFDAVPGSSPNTGNATLVTYGPSQGTCTAPSGGVLSCDLGPLAVGASATVAIIVRANAKGVLRNAVSILGASEDPNTNNNTAELLSTVTSTADLAVAIAQSPANPVGLGTNTTYTVWVSNNGPDVADSVDLELELNGFTQISHSPSQIPCSGTPIVTCNVGALVGTTSPGIIQQILTFTLAPAATGTFTNTARVSGNADDLNPTNDSATVTSEIIVGQPKLRAYVEDVTRLSSATVRVVIQFRNVGTGLANNIKMTQAPVQLVAGTGAVSLAQPPLPHGMGNLLVGANVGVTFIINAPIGVTTITLTEIGTMEDFAANPVNFSIAQKINVP